MDEHEDLRSESSSEKSNVDESSLVERSSDEEDSEVDIGRGDNTKEGLEDNDGGVELEVDDHNFRPVWKDDADGYLQGVRECGSSTTGKWERKRKLEKSAPTIRSIVDIFPTQLNKNQFSGKGPLPTLPAVSPPKISKEKVRETRFKSQTRAVHDLGELLCLKTVQIDRYGHVLDYKSNLYLRHQMVNSFL